MNEDIKGVVRQKYGEIAQSSGSGGGCGCGPSAAELSKRIGYSDSDLQAVPQEANLGLGCGNPVALASLREGETVLDLGSGAGFDCFLAAERVGATGHVIGVDMTAEMLEAARRNARKGNYTNVEFRLGEIENLPVSDGSVDAVISNCVINLSPDKERVFREAFRVLRPGGRLMVSDIVLTQALPEVVRNSLEAYVGCVAGAALKDDYLNLIRAAGFTDIQVVHEASFPAEDVLQDPTVDAARQELGLDEPAVKEMAAQVVSLTVHAAKPAAAPAAKPQR